MVWIKIANCYGNENTVVWVKIRFLSMLGPVG